MNAAMDKPQKMSIRKNYKMINFSIKQLFAFFFCLFVHSDTINISIASYTPIIAATFSMTGRLLLDIFLIYP